VNHAITDFGWLTNLSPIPTKLLGLKEPENGVQQESPLQNALSGKTLLRTQQVVVAPECRGPQQNTEIALYSSFDWAKVAM